MSTTKTIFTHGKMIETVTIKSEPSSEEEVEEILPDPLELPTKVKSVAKCKEELGSNLNDNQENCENEKKKTNFVSEKMLVNINGVLYLLEKIPDNVVKQEIQTKEAVAYTGKDLFSNPVPCPYCGKELKRRKNLKLHMQVCLNSFSYNCTLCPYRTSNKTSFDFHVSVCKKESTSQAILDSNEDLFSRVCPKCNLSMPLETKLCGKCGSLNRWQCKNCSKHFESFSTVRHHYKTTCKPVSYYHCQKCDYRSAFNLHILAHMRRSHPELKSHGSLKYIKKIKVPTGVNEVKHLCSKCGKNFDEPEKLNRHTYLCKKSKSQKLMGKIDNSDSSQTDSSIELACYKQSIVRHCKTCNKDVESEDSSVALQKSCDSCSSTLAYKCIKCGILHENRDVILNHVKSPCSQQKLIKCDDCDFTTDSKGKLIQHQRNLHGDISATCTNCTKYFTNSTLFMWHVASCGTSRVYHCEKCPYTTLKKEYLQRHINSSHGKSNDSIADSNFSKIQPRIQSFCIKCQRRQQMHNRAKFCKICRSELQFRCLTCNKMCSIDKSDACEHVKVHLKQLGLECQRCGRRFSDRSKYQLHIECCGKTRRHNCELCSYSTRFVNHLQRHKQEVHHMSSEIENAHPRKILSGQSKKCTAERQYFSDESETNKVDLKEEICMKMNEDLDTLPCQDSGMEAKNSNLISYKNERENKLNLQCKVVLTRLNM